MVTLDNHFKSIDSVLGSGDDRFFGMGFRKVMQGISNIKIYPQNEGNFETGKINANAAMYYPINWSKKKENVELSPHLSSVDALVLSTQLIEMYITHKYQLNEEQRQTIWLRSITMKASSNPQEDLSDFNIESIQLSVNKYMDTEHYISIFEAQIGTIYIKSEIVHEIQDFTSEVAFYDSVNDLLGMPTTRYYGEGYKTPKQIIKDLNIDLKGQRAVSLVTIEQPEDISLINCGIEGKYRPSISMVDCMLIIAQLGQALLYRLDNITRDNSNTLWMRKVFMESDNPYQPCDNLEASTHIVKSRLLPVNNSYWRSSDMIGYCRGLKVEYSIAHELPKSCCTLDNY